MAKPYISEATHFINALKKADPTLESKQREGRARLWDKTLTLSQLDADANTLVPTKAYAYQTNNDWVAK